MMCPLVSSDVSRTRYMFASGISRRTRLHTSAPSTCGIIQSRMAIVGTAGVAAPCARRYRSASAPSDTTVTSNSHWRSVCASTAAAMRSSSATSTCTWTSRERGHCSRPGPVFRYSVARPMKKSLPASLAASLREHDAMLGGLIRNNPTAIVVLDRDQHVQLANPAFEQLFGYREPEIAGKKIASLLVPADSVSESNRVVASGLAGESASTIAHRRRKDGSLVDVEVTFVPFTDNEGNPAGTYAFYRNLSAQRVAERHLHAQFAVV